MWCYQRLHFWRVMSWIFGFLPFFRANDFTLLVIQGESHLQKKCLWNFSLVNYPSSIRSREDSSDWNFVDAREFCLIVKPNMSIGSFWWKRYWGFSWTSFILINRQYTMSRLWGPQRLAPPTNLCIRQAECTIINFTVTEDGVWDGDKTMRRPCPGGPRVGKIKNLILSCMVIWRVFFPIKNNI